jgi:hypothetical protein
MTQSSTDSLVERLRLAIATASNDDDSKPGDDKRLRHVARIDTMSEAADRISALGRELEGARALVKKEQEAWMDIERANRELFDGAVDDILKAAEARATAAEAKAARMGEALKPFSEAAGGVFTRNANASDVLFRKPATASHAESVITAGHLFAARSALQSEEDRKGQP